MFTKYHNFFLSNRFLKIFRFKTNSQTKPIRLQISLPCMSCRSFVGLCIHSFIPSFMHPCIHLFKSLTTLHFKFLCQKFLQHNVVAWLDQHSWLQFSDNSFYFNTLLKTILVIWLCWWSYCRRWGKQAPCYLFLCSFRLCLSASEVLLCKNPALVWSREFLKAFLMSK